MLGNHGANFAWATGYFPGLKWKLNRGFPKFSIPTEIEG